MRTTGPGHSALISNPFASPLASDAQVAALRTFLSAPVDAHFPRTLSWMNGTAEVKTAHEHFEDAFQSSGLEGELAMYLTTGELDLLRQNIDAVTEQATAAGGPGHPKVALPAIRKDLAQVDLRRFVSLHGVELSRPQQAALGPVYASFQHAQATFLDRLTLATRRDDRLDFATLGACFNADRRALDETVRQLLDEASAP